MNKQQRHERLRLLIKKLNRERKKQAKQIDILCNDFISAQKDFITKLKTISFMAGFYESIIGIADLSELLSITTRLIKIEYPDVSITFFLRQEEGFEIHMFGGEHPITFGKEHLENCFNQELMDSICKSNKMCTLEDIFTMDMQGSLVGLNKVSLLTIPLSKQGSSFGFILVCRSSTNKLTANEINNISAIISGLCQAIISCRTISQNSN